MKNIEFIPKEFHDVKLGYNETEMNPCSPGYPEELFSSNMIVINIPQKIIYRLDKDSVVQPMIPVCMLYVVSAKRSLKYDSLSQILIHMSKGGISDEIYRGDIYDNNPDLQHEHPSIDPFAEESEKERAAMVREAQNYSEEELDEGTDWGRFININLLDYVDIPIEAGRYEIWVTYYGLESNRAFVEIIVE